MSQCSRTGGKGEGLNCRRAFIRNLRYATEIAAESRINILIEPLNRVDVPGYFLWNIEDGVSIVDDVGADNLKIMFDCYHIQVMQGNLLHRIKQYFPYIGHIQFSSVPGRQQPDIGEINYPWLLGCISDLGYVGMVGAEYKPGLATIDSLSWLENFRKILI